MNRFARILWTLLASRAVTPMVIGIFLVLYIIIAFFTEETLITLMELTRRSMILAAVLALLPANSICRIAAETVAAARKRRCLNVASSGVAPEMFDEQAEVAASLPLAEVEARLQATGYRTRHAGSQQLAAWRGVSAFPARVLFLVGTFCLFSGILISLVSRTVTRGAAIEGEAVSWRSGTEGLVERIRFSNASGPILAKDLNIEVVFPGGAGERRSFGLYPPSLLDGKFVYPRYLGVALHFRFFAPDLPGGYEKFASLSIYPPGKEASVEVPGAPYRLILSLAKSDDGTDPYMTGRMVFPFKLMKGKDVLYSGSVAAGGEFVKDGYRLVCSDVRRMVLTDFIGDYGVYLVLVAFIVFILSAGVFLPLRIFLPRREMLFVGGQDGVVAYSRAEGRRRRHNSVFHEALDFIGSRTSGSSESSASR